MTLSQFTALLTAKHPTATVARSADTGGATVKTGLTVTFDDTDKMYHYQGSFQEIAQAMGLLEKWYVLENGGVVGMATSETEASQKMTELKAQAEKTAAAWGGQVGEFTIRKV
jgi:hypothetical protein